MIDQLRGTRQLAQDVWINPDYAPNQAVTTMELSGPTDADHLTVLFPPWHGGGTAYDHLKKRLGAAGSAVLDLKFSDFILGPNADEVVQSYGVVEEKVATELDRLAEEHHYRQVHAFGASLGNVALGVVARRFNGFTDTTMVVAGSNLARSMWEGFRTQRLRGYYEAQGVSEDALDKAWHDLAPKTNAGAFNGKPVRLFMSSKDDIIPSKYQVEMERELTGAGAHVRSRTSRLGHYLSVGASCYLRKTP